MNKPDEFEKNAKVILDDSLDDLSPDITRRLQQARYAALEKAKSKPAVIWTFFPKAATAIIAISVISMSMFFYIVDEEVNGTQLAIETETETEIEILTANESLDLLEDLEFIQWLAESEEYAS